MGFDKPFRFVKPLNEIGDDPKPKTCIRMPRPEVVTAATCRPFLLRTITRQKHKQSQKKKFYFKYKNPEQNSKQVRLALMFKEWNRDTLPRKFTVPTSSKNSDKSRHRRPHSEGSRGTNSTDPCRSKKSKKLVDSIKKRKASLTERKEIGPLPDGQFDTYGFPLPKKRLEPPEHQEFNNNKILCEGERKTGKKLQISPYVNSTTYHSIFGPAAEQVVWQPSRTMAYELVGTKGVHVRKWEDDSKQKIMQKQKRNMNFKNHHWKSTVFDKDDTKKLRGYKYNNILTYCESDKIDSTAYKCRSYGDVRNPITGQRIDYNYFHEDQNNEQNDFNI